MPSFAKERGVLQRNYLLQKGKQYRADIYRRLWFFSWNLDTSKGKWKKLQINMFSKTNRIINGKPMYVRLGNTNLQLTYTNESGYPTPWTMWTKKSHPLSHFAGFLKISPRDVDCPENAFVSFISTSTQIWCSNLLFFISQNIYYKTYKSQIMFETSKFLFLKCGIWKF